MTRVYRTVLVLGLALSAGAGLTSCNKKPGVPSAQAKEAEVITVQTQTVTTAPMASTLKVTGSLEGTREAVVSSETNGRVTAVIRTIGDRVGAGAPMIKVDDELKAIAVQQADAQRLSAEAALEKANVDLQRTQQLFKDNAVTKNQLELAQLQVKSADAALKGAQTAESLAKRQLADATIKAPFAGVVSQRLVNQGEMLNAGTHVVTLVDDSQMKFRMGVGELDVSSLKVGQKVALHVDALGTKELEGHISAISDKADNARSFQVEVAIPNPNHELKSGMFARAEIQRESQHDVPTAPNNAIMTNGSKTQVYIVKDGIANLRAVKVGTATNDRVEILDGLNAGDEVVTFGQNRLTDGAKVRK